MGGTGAISKLCDLHATLRLQLLELVDLFWVGAAAHEDFAIAALCQADDAAGGVNSSSVISIRSTILAESSGW
jgi:hypothetical protein